MSQLFGLFNTPVVLTTNRVRIFDEMIRSRIRLDVYVNKWDTHTHKSMWKNIIDDLNGKSSMIEVSDLLIHIDDFVEWPLNGWEINNMVKMATQLACAQDQMLRREHFDIVSNKSREFSRYLRDLPSSAAWMNSRRK
jgi:SpoVK/Ycf46/Vps4 family AAA+-type ATPase